MDFPGIQRIELPTPFPVGPANAFLVGRSTLVDCGPRTPAAWDALQRGLAAAGCPVEAVSRLVLTHPHHDHAGLAARVRRASDCAVYAHPVDHPRLLGAPGTWDAIAGFLLEVCRRGGAPRPVVEGLSASLETLDGYAEPLDAVMPLEDGDQLSVDGGALAVLHTPGHARGSLCLWDPTGRRLFSGDTLLPRISSNAILEPGAVAFRTQTLLQYRAQLRRLAALTPRAVWPGHGDPLGDPGPLIARRLALHEVRAERVLALVREGFERPWALVERLFPAVPVGASFLAVSEVVGHLDLLAARGAVCFEGQEGEWVATAVG